MIGFVTALQMESDEDPKPSLFPLEKDGSKVCLATGFGRHDKLKDNPLFSDSDGTFIDRQADDPAIKGLYSQVAPMSSSDDEKLCEETIGSVDDDTIDNGPLVNLVSLTVLVLRIIFVKTVAFNVLMTLRLGLSR